MEYTEIKERLSETDELAEVLDAWQEGIPFFYQEEEVVYDAFLFYSGNRQKSMFHRAERLILLNCSTGEVKCLFAEELEEKFQVEKDFSYTSKAYKDIDEYFALKQQVEDAYLAVRVEVLKNDRVENSQGQYMQAARNFLPQELIEKVYKKLNESLFK